MDIRDPDTIRADFILDDIAVLERKQRWDAGVEQFGTVNQKGLDSSSLRIHRCRKLRDPRSEDSDSGGPKREKVTPDLI